MRKVIINLSISAQDYLAHYQGIAQDVVATSSDGLNIRFPCTILKPFVTHSGIYGQFVISFDDNNKFQKIERLT